MHLLASWRLGAALVFQTRERFPRYIESVPTMRGLGDRVPTLTAPFRLPEKTTVFEARASSPR
jgi:hypothetical protein